MIQAAEANRRTEHRLHPDIAERLAELERKLDLEIERRIAEGLYNARFELPIDLVSGKIASSVSKFIQNIRDHGYVVELRNQFLDVYWW